jgi:hypothetical protein
MNSRSRWSAALYYGFPMLFCLGIHWLALKTWFYADDFAWLGLRLELHAPRDLIHVLFGAEAQGTVRTISERLFFLVFSSMFGLEAPPFRIWVFLTQFVNLVLLIRIARRLTGSAAAAQIAAILWSANAGLATAMGWTSAYNEIALALFILLGFHLFLQYLDTGKRKFLIWQWIVFVLGFGVLELNVMYPVLVTGYSLCWARRHLRPALFLFIPSIVFAALHFIFVPAPSDPYYQMHFGPSLIAMLGAYWTWAVGAYRKTVVDWRPTWLGLLVAVSIASALALFAWRKVRGGDWRPVFMLGWFIAMLLPVLPLENHFTDYYVVVPSIGLCMLGGWAFTEARGSTRPFGVALAVLYLIASITDIRTVEKYNYNRARTVKYLVKGLASLPKTESNKMIFVTGVDNDLFWNAFYPDAFRLIGITQIFLLPGSERDIDPHPEMGGISRFVMNAGPAALELASGRAVVLQLEGRQLRDVSTAYKKQMAGELDGRGADWVNVADPQYASRLGVGWYPADNGFRWMAQNASLKMERPKKVGQTLKITGYCPAALVAKGSLEVSFHVGNITIGAATLKKPDEHFELEFKLPPELVGSSTMDVEIAVSRAIKPAGDTRSLGLIFGTFAIQ